MASADALVASSVALKVKEVNVHSFEALGCESIAAAVEAIGSAFVSIASPVVPNRPTREEQTDRGLTVGPTTASVLRSNSESHLDRHLRTTSSDQISKSLFAITDN